MYELVLMAPPKQHSGGGCSSQEKKEKNVSLWNMFIPFIDTNNNKKTKQKQHPFYPIENAYPAMSKKEIKERKASFIQICAIYLFCPSFVHAPSFSENNPAVSVESCRRNNR